MSNNPTSQSNHLDSEVVQQQHDCAATPHRHATDPSVFDLAELHDALSQSVHELEQSIDHADDDTYPKRTLQPPTSQVDSIPIQTGSQQHILVQLQIPQDQQAYPPQQHQLMHAEGSSLQIRNQSVPTSPQMLNASAQATPQSLHRLQTMLANNQSSYTPNAAMAAAAALNLSSANPSVPVISPRTPFQPLNAQMFQTLFANWCVQHKLVKDDDLAFEDRPIDLYALHTAVMRAGGVQRVTQTDHWPIIGAQLGFIQLMGTGDEPPRSGPQIAQRLMNVYEKYLHQFDVAYMRSLVQRIVQMQNGGQPVQNMHNGQDHPPMNQTNNGMVNHMSGGLNVQGAQPQPPQARPQMTPLNHLSQMTGINDPAKLNELSQFSMYPAELLRARGINEGVINMVELHRALLQRFMQAQKNFVAKQRQLMMANNGTLPRISDPMPNSQPGGPVAIPRARPSAEDMQRATVVVHNMHKEFQQRTAAMNFRFIELPEQQRFEYNKTFEQLYRYASDVQDKLPFFAYYFQEDMLRKLFTMLYSTTQQRAFLSSGNPKFFMNLEQIREMCRHFQLAVDRYNS